MPKVIDIKNGSVSAQSSLQVKKKRATVKGSFSQTYIVLSDTLDDNESDILATPGIPPKFYPSGGYLCSGHRATETTRIVHPVTGVAAAMWDVEVEFRNDINPEDEQPPESLPPVVRWFGETEEEQLEEDAITGAAIETAAGEKIDVTHPVVRPVLEIRRYESYPFDPDVMLDYSNRVNSTPFWGAPIASALMMPMDVDEETIEGEKYAVVTYRIKFKIQPGATEPWKAKVLNYGTLIVDANGDIVKNADKFGRVYTTNLAANGTKLPDGDPKVYISFNRFQKADFNLLSLGPF